MPQFVGRESELATLTGLLDQGGAGIPPAVVISAIGGTAGVGKTALAVHWAHQVAGRFPDGQLYVNLRGVDPSGKPTPSSAAIRGLLGALAVPAEQIPADLDAQAGLYRSLLAGRRMLVMLDNARDVAQVRPLLPGGPGCVVVVTSRSQLLGLATAEGACTLTLDLLTQAEARELLAQRLGDARLSAEPDAVAELIRLCTRLPLALAIVAAKASARPWFRLGALAQELQQERGRLDALETRDTQTSVRTVFSWSLGGLPVPAARMFGLLGVHPGPDITVPAAASLARASLRQAGRALRDLAEGHLVTEQAPGRFAMHDLLRAYAAEQAADQETEKQRSAVIERMLDYYLHASHAAALLLNPSREPVTLTPPPPGVALECLTTSQQALAWFEAEHRVLISTIATAAQTGFDAHAWRLAWAMDNYLDWRGHWQEWAATQHTAVAAATRLGDTAGQATARRLLGHTCARLGDYDQARAHLTHCLGLYQQLGDRLGEGRVHQTLGWVAERQNRYADALGHAEQALALYRASEDRARQAAALNNVGWCHALLGAYQQARMFSRQALDMHRQLGDRPGEAGTWDTLGYAEHQLGNLAEAANCHRHALDIARDLGDRYAEAEFLSHLGDVRHTAGNRQEAWHAWQQAMAILSDLHHPDASQVRAKLQHLGPLPAKPSPAPA
jgi:tetratricopeptide (TPR) repeat protein